MATKISESTSSTAESTDLVPIAKPGDATARFVPADALVKAVQASTSARGSVELATTAETQAGTDDERAVTPAGLKVYFEQDLDFGVDSSANKMRLYAQGTGDWWMSSGQATFSGNPDQLLYYGYNLTGSEVRPNESLHAWYMAFESYYYVGATEQYTEWYLEYLSSDGLTTARPIISQYNMYDDTCQNQLRGKLILYNSAGNQMIGVIDDTSGPMTFYNDTFCRFYFNNSKILEQLNAAENAFISIAYVTGDDRIFFGDTGVDLQSNGDMYFGLTDVGPILIDRATSAARRIICTNGTLSTEALS